MLRRGANFLEQRDRLSLQQIIEHFKFLINLNPRSFNTALILTASFLFGNVSLRVQTAAAEDSAGVTSPGSFFQPLLQLSWNESCD